MTQDASHPRLSSAEIVAVTTELRHRQANRRKKKDGKGKENPEDAKRELVMEEHKLSISELVADLGTDAANVSYGILCLMEDRGWNSRKQKLIQTLRCLSLGYESARCGNSLGSRGS